MIHMKALGSWLTEAGNLAGFSQGFETCRGPVTCDFSVGHSLEVSDFWTRPLGVLGPRARTVRP